MSFLNTWQYFHLLRFVDDTGNQDICGFKFLETVKMNYTHIGVLHTMLYLNLRTLCGYILHK